MKYKAFYMSREIIYHEADSEDGMIQKIYEIQNVNKEPIIEIPSGCMEIRCILQDGVFHMQLYKGVESFTDSALSSCDSCVGIRLSPGVQLSGQEELLKEGYSHPIFKAMANPMPIEHRMKLLRQVFPMKELVTAQYPVTEILNEVEMKRGCLNIGTYLATFPYSDRYIEKAFKEATGFTVKKYAQIVKLQNALQMISEGNLERCDKLEFYDQAHFIREFKKFTSVTPMQYRRQRLEMATF